jgi:hypothetical protein
MCLVLSLFFSGFSGPEVRKNHGNDFYKLVFICANEPFVRGLTLRKEGQWISWGGDA